MKPTIFVLAILTMFSCEYKSSTAQQLGFSNSSAYKPLTPREEENFKKADKTILPNDVRRRFNDSENKSVIWTGIVDTVIYSMPVDTIMLVDVYLQHRYYDFIEDFSIQQEKMFVSPYGEGEYIFRQAIVGKKPFAQIKSDLQKSIFKECLILSYGTVTFLQNSIPLLTAENIRIVFPENYATNISSYKVERDINNKLVLSEAGSPNLVNFERLMIPKAGRNQLGSRLENSKK